MHKSYKKTVAILITCALIGALLCLPVSAEDPVTDVMYANCRFYNLSFSTFDSNGNWLSNPTSSNIALGFFESGSFYDYSDEQGVGLSITTSTASSFGGSSGYYRTFIFKIDLPYSDDNQNFSMTLDLYGQNDASNNLSLGKNTFFKCGSKTATLTKNSDGTVDVELNNVTETTISCQISFVNTNSWRDAEVNFLNIKVRGTGTQQIIDNQNENTDREIEADKENTQAIIDNQNELAEQEKQEITDSGNQATDAGDSIPNESDGFVDALGTFVDTMSTTSTDCSLTFPAIKIPSFAGIPATTLSEEKDIDISAAVGLIPEDIMKLIQALTTIALIVFCFKELYDTISEALTRKKANADG